MNIGRRFPWPLLASSFVVGALLVWAGCGGSADYPANEPNAPERDNPVELENEQLVQVQELETALARPEPDCSSACDLSSLICELSERICGIAERHPTDRSTQGRCRDASERCDRASERVREGCTCAVP